MEKTDIYKIKSVKRPDGTRDWDLLRRQIYRKYSKEDMEDQINQFREENLDLSVLNDAGKSLSKLCVHFFREEQYKAKNARAIYSPHEVLSSDELLEQAFEKIDKKADYYNADSDYKNFLSFITNEATMVSKVAIFSPNLARKIYEKYCPEFYANVHDSSCGWGNRCQGALISKYEYNYYGTDPNSSLHPKYKEQAEFIRNALHTNNVTDFRCCGSEEFIPEWEGKMDISFTSPPYFNTEKYSDELTQSAAKCANYYSWRDDFMRPTIKNVFRYLKPNSYYLLNLKNLTSSFGSFPALNDWAIVAQQEGFILENIIMMYYQSSRQFGTSKKTGKKREVNFTGDREPVLVLRKPKEGEERKFIVVPGINTIDKSWENRNKKPKKVQNKKVEKPQVELNQKLEYTTDFPTPITDSLMPIYNYFSKEQDGKSEEIHIPKGYKKLVEYLNGMMYKNENKFIDDIELPKVNLVDNSDIVIVGYSSGVDSTYQALRFKHEGKEVVLLHLKNLNGSYPDESKSCEEFAEKYGLKLVEVPIKHLQKEKWIDNPVKNQVLCIGLAIDLAVKIGAKTVSLGNHEDDDISTSHIQYSYTDAVEVFNPFFEGLKTHVKGLEYLPLDRNKLNCFKFIVDNYPESLKYVNSCISPQRFKRFRNKQIREKFGIETVSDNRCMLCTKCIKEYVMLCHLGYYKPNDAYIEHFCNHLKNKGNDIPDLRLVFDKNATKEEILKAILDT